MGNVPYCNKVYIDESTKEVMIQPESESAFRALINILMDEEIVFRCDTNDRNIILYAETKDW